VLWGKDNLNGPEAFWVDVGRGVLWPLLLLARATGRGMDDVRLQAHPEQMVETLVSVGAALGELAPGHDSDAARRQWAVNSSLDVRCRRMAFTYAYRLVHYWQYTAMWADSGGT